MSLESKLSVLLDALKKLGYPTDKAIEGINEIGERIGFDGPEFTAQAEAFLRSLLPVGFEEEVARNVLAEILSIRAKGPVPPAPPAMTA